MLSLNQLFCYDRDSHTFVEPQLCGSFYWKDSSIVCSIFKKSFLLFFPKPQDNVPTKLYVALLFFNILYLVSQRPTGMAVPLLIIVTLCHLTEKSIRNNGKLFTAFIDHPLAFDCEQEPAMG